MSCREAQLWVRFRARFWEGAPPGGTGVYGERGRGVRYESCAATGEALLLDWLAHPRPAKGLRVLDDSGSFGELIDYPRLAERALRVAAAIRQSAHGEGPVVIVLPNGPEFLTAFFGCLAAGRTPCPVAPHVAFGDRDRYVEHAARVLHVARPSLLICDAASDELMRETIVVSGERMPLLDAATVASCVPDPASPPPRVGLLQFTSGSTGRPRGVLVSMENLNANLRMNTRWLDIAPDDRFALWLPMFHDMGLIGTLSMMVNQIDVMVLTPLQFIAQPARWLDCFGRHGATLGVTPAFGLGYSTKRVRDEQLEGCDFSGWRTVVIGSDPIDPHVLQRFARRVSAHGFNRSALVPAYGLAEATLSVSGHWNPRRRGSRDEDLLAVQLDWSRASFGGPVPILDQARLQHQGSFEGGAGWVTSCGRPHPELTVRIVNEGRELPEGHLGEIVLSGPSVAEGCLGAEGSSSTRLEPGRLYTGDAGFLLDGCLYVVGRLGDSFKVRGRAVFAEDLDRRLAAAPLVPVGRCVVLSGIVAGAVSVVGLVEREPGFWMEPAARALARGLPDEVNVAVLSVPRGTIQRTSSGKPKRRSMWAAFVDGLIPVEDTCQVSGRRPVEV